MLNFKKIVLLAALSCSTSAYAQEDVLKSWYGALSPVNRDTVSMLLTQDALIELKDYDLVQNKDEFLESLDSWEEAIEGGSIKYKIKDDQGDDSVTAIVCYTFSSNQLMTEEVFELSDVNIQKSTQTTIAEDCADF